jgi:hypothetical protein
MVGRVTFRIFRFIWLAALIFVYRTIQLIFYIRGDQEGLFFFVQLDTDSRIIDKYYLTFQIKLNILNLFESLKRTVNLYLQPNGGHFKRFL